MKKKIILSMALAISLVFPLTAQAEEKDTPLVIPDTPAAIWRSVDREMDEMSKMIQAGTLKDLHHHAFAVRDLVAALPAGKEGKIKSDSKFVATLADRLDTAGDGNDKLAATSNFQKLQDVLKSMRWNYSDSDR
jgi:hypothetical protein